MTRVSPIEYSSGVSERNVRPSWRVYCIFPPLIVVLLTMRQGFADASFLGIDLYLSLPFVSKTQR